MSDTLGSATWRRLLRLCVDAFLLTGLLFVLTQGVLAALAAAVGFDEGDPPVWLGLLSPLLAVAAVVGGAVSAWLLHGRTLSWPVWLGMALGAVLGAPLVSAAFMAVAGLSQLVPWRSRESEGPWFLVALVTLAVVAFLAVPVVDAVRDLTGARETVVADRVRLVALLLTVLVVAITTAIGVSRSDETGEVGLFLVLVAVPAATSVVGADLVLRSRARRTSTTRAPVPPDAARPA
ncbi:hypothetical protein ACTHAM_001842 [Cellulomonas soli]|uniref:hypothetical protein n=1 Tax=Cellulomonas soli TaxID=931535 RepID=UPI003F844295